MRGALLALLLIAPGALASGERSFGPVKVIIDNGRGGEGCLEELTGFCAASWDGRTLDATQNMERLAIHLSHDVADPLLPLPLLPGGEIAFDISKERIRHPVFETLTPVVSERSGPAPISDYVVTMNRSGIFIQYYGADPGQPLEPFRVWTYSFRYADNGSAYNEIRMPLSNEGGIRLGEEPRNVATIACQSSSEIACFAPLGDVGNQTSDIIPDLLIGAGVEETSFSHGNVTESARAPTAAFSPAQHAKTMDASSHRTSPLSLSTPPLPVGYNNLGGTHLDGRPPSNPQPRSDPAPERSELSEGPMARTQTVVLPLAASFALALVLASLYARIRSRQDALALATRQRLVDALEREGPCTVSDLARHLAVDRSTALYHIRVLRRSMTVQLAQVGRLVYVLLPGQTPPSLPPSFRDGAAEVVLGVLRAAGGALSRAELHAHAAAVPHRQRNEVLRQLTEKGVVERAFVGNAEVVRLAVRPLQASTPAPVVFK